MKDKSTRILYVLKILKEGSDKYHPIYQMTIKKVLNELDIECDRRSVSRDIETLKNFGYDIVKNSGGGCYFNSPEFSDFEIEIMLQGVKNIDFDLHKKHKLIAKINELRNIYNRYK